MNENMNERTNGRGELLRSIRHPLAFFALAVLVVEGVMAITATVAFRDQVMLLFILFLILIVVLLFVVSIVAYIVIKYPQNIMAEFEKATDNIIRGLSDFQKKTLLEISQKGDLEY
jgi:hypothetical protein